MLKQQCLNGVWDYRIGYGAWGEITVPYSCHPVGHSECCLGFDLTESGKKIELEMQGVTYHATVYLNGTKLGEMLPYSVYRFDITDTVKKKNNCLHVELEDIDCGFGPSRGWENFGGIIRSVYVNYYGEAQIEDVFAHATLKNDYKDADLTVELTATWQDDVTAEVALFDGRKKVFSYLQKAGEGNKTTTLEGVTLWSPENPKLYELSVTLYCGKKVVDTYACPFGFREIACERHRFLLNGKPIFLQGVCKHEMIGEGGHCPSQAEIEKELRRIKDETGCNYVRLVHYPHCAETIEIADRIGLLVSEEPGLWWSDTSKPEIASGSIEVLRRVIMRDRNHPSVAFWLCFNECKFTEQFLIDSAEMCKKTDPYRLVSGANCMSNEDTLKYYNICGFDFYTMHPYAQSFDRAAKSAKLLNDKPLLFTEWGGHFVYNNPKLLAEFIEEMIKLYRKNSDEGALAGASFWMWSEIHEYLREEPATIDGMLREGLVDIDRKQLMIFDTFVEAWKGLHTEKKTSSFYEPFEAEIVGTPFVGQGEKKSFEAMKEAVVFQPSALLDQSWRHFDIVGGPVLPRAVCQGVETTPWMLEEGESVTFTGSVKTACLQLFGGTSLCFGYPRPGVYGDVVAEMTVNFENGKSETFPLRNGIEVTTAQTTLGSSRINPVGEKAIKHAYFGYNRNWEDYVLNRVPFDLGRERLVSSVVITSKNGNYKLLVYGLLG